VITSRHDLDKVWIKQVSMSRCNATRINFVAGTLSKGSIQAIELEASHHLKGEVRDWRKLVSKLSQVVNRQTEIKK
jgi:hypothetical protein